MSRSHRFCLCITARGARRSRRGAAIAAVAGIACAVPLPAAAVGLGAITQQSGLGQTLRVVIPVTLGEGEEMPAECFRLAPGQGVADGVPELLFGRVNVERSAAGTTLVVTTPRPVNDPVVRITIRAGCETSVRREYTLFMDPPAIEAPVTAAQPSPREVLGLPPPEPAPREARRPPKPQAQPRTAARSAQAPSSAANVDATDKGAPGKARAAPRVAPRPPPGTAAARPRLSVSSGAPGTLPGSLATEADRERARQERANAIEAETAVLRQRIVELTAMVERMQQELRAQEAAEQAQAAKATAEAANAPADAAKAPVGGGPATVVPEAAKAPAQDATPAADAATKPDAPAKPAPPAPVPSWWEQNSLLLGAIVGLPLLIAAFLLWKRQREAKQDDVWRAHTASIRPDTLSRASQLRNAPAGLAMPDRRTVAPGTSREMDGPAPARDAVDALAVSELSHVTEEARVFMALGHNDRAIDVLQDHIRRLPRSMPAAWLMLLDLYHQEGDRSEFRKLADDFHVHFNVRTPLWEEFVADSPLTGGIESFPVIEQQIVKLWRQPNCRAYLEGLLYDNREGRRNGFPLAAYSDILALLQVLDAPPEVDIDEDLVAAGKLEGRPKAKTAAAAPARKPMPPDPSASRPAQQPIRFEIEPQDAGDRKR